MVLLDALPAEYGLMVGAKEVHHSVRMQRAELLFHALLVVLVKIEVALRQLLVFLHNLVQDVDVERQSLGRVKILYQFSANGAPHSILVVQLGDAAGAKRVAAVN